MTPVEAAFAAMVLAALTKWLTRMAKKVLAPWTANKSMPDPSAVFTEDETWSNSVDVLASWLERHPARDGWESIDQAPAWSTSQFVQQHIAQVRNLLKGIPDEVFGYITDEIAKGVANGDSTPDIARRIENILSVDGSKNWRARANLIAVTEVNGAHNAGWYASALRTQEDLGTPLMKRWLATRDDHTRSTHKAANKQTVPVTAPFIVGGFPMLYPGDKAGPPEEVINCVTADSLVHVPDIERAFRFKWNGPIFTLRGKRGLRGTVSPYHPVLTERGWVPACEINKGDYVLCAPDWHSWALPDVKSPPTEAQDVYDSLAQSVAAHWVEAVGVDFHGDRPQGDVDVVLADRVLARARHPEHEKLREEFLFALANSPNASQSPLFHVGDGVPTPPGGIVSRRSLLESFGRVHPGPLDSLGLAAPTGPDAQFQQAPVDPTAGDTEISREAFDRFAAAVSFDQIVKVDVTTYHGYLYSFETKTGIYIADGTVTHNCRCTAVTLEP